MMKSKLPIILMVLFFLASWFGIFFFGQHFLELSKTIRIISVLTFAATWGMFLWYCRPRDP
jgi:hypothetical protein